MRTMLVVFMLLMLNILANPGLADEKTRERPEEILKKVQDIDRQIDNLRRIREEMEEAAEEAGRLAERRDELADIQNDSREFLQEYDAEMAELRERGDLDTETGRAFTGEFKKHLATSLDLHKQILAITDAAMLEKAEELAARAEVIATEWWMVLRPQYEFGVWIKEMEDHADEEGTPEHQEIIKKLKEIHEEDMANRRKEFELAQKRLKNQAAMDIMVEEFWEE